jgi:hypothetical protein
LSDVEESDEGEESDEEEGSDDGESDEGNSDSDEDENRAWEESRMPSLRCISRFLELKVS